MPHIQHENFHVTSIYGVKTNEALVEVMFMGNKFQVVTSEARKIAMLLIECAEAAEQDAALFNWAVRNKFTKEKAAQLIVMVRRAREERYTIASES